MDTAPNYAEQAYSAILSDRDTLEKHIHEYPASTLARFLYLYHHKKNGNPELKQLAQFTGIYFNNPLWMRFQLMQAETSATAPPAEDNSEQPLPTGNNGTLLASAVEDTLAGEIKVQSEEDTELQKEFSQPEQPEITIAEAVPSFLEEESISPIEEELPTQAEKVPEIFNTGSIPQEITEGENTHAQELGSPFVEDPLPVVTDPEANEAIVENKDMPEEEGTSFSGQIQETQSRETQTPEHIEEIQTITDTPSAPAEVINPVAVPDNENDSSFKPENTISPVEEPGINNPPILTEDKGEAPPPQETKQTAEGEEKEAFPFEPLHTVDYFASQGIKITEEALGDDELGKHVRSFTAWLKSMKKLHPGQLPEQNEVIEKIIQSSSEASNQNANILTEAMAEVLVKQDKREKAIEMYRKLSLLNPGKSAYFAAKIKNLNTL